MYVYIRSEPHLWTVGHYDGTKWIPESDHDTESKAADRTIRLNGGMMINPTVEDIKQQIALACDVHYNRGVNAAAAIVQTVIGELSEEQYQSHKEVLEIVYTSINRLKIN